MRYSLFVFLLGLSIAGCVSTPQPVTSNALAASSATSVATAGAEPVPAAQIAGAAAAQVSAPPAVAVQPAEAAQSQPTQASTVTTPPASPSSEGSISGSVVSMPARSASAAVVYLENAPVSKVVDAVLDNKQMTFVPLVDVVTVGGTVKFTNHDPFPHNIFSGDNEKFNLGSLSPGAVKSKVFNQPGAYTLLCNIHPNMKSYLVVTPSSYFAKADKSGAYTIAGVPSGTYRVTAWAPGVKSSTQTVTVNGGDTQVDFDLKRK